MNSQTINLTEQQSLAFSKFSRLKVGALFMKQGTGKTRTALELARYNEGKWDTVLYLCPFSVKDEAEKEFNMWYPEANHVIVGYETLSSSDRTYIELLEHVKNNRCFLVCDESLFVKNESAKRTQRTREIRTHCEYAIILNGTPVSRDVWDLKRQMDILSPNIIGMNDDEFRDVYFKRVDYKRSFESPKHFYKLYEPNIKHLVSLIEPYTFVCDLEFELGERTENHIFMCGDDALERYDNVRAKMLNSIQRFDDARIVSWLTVMRHISACDDERLDYVAGNAKGRCIVFCNFIDEAQGIAERLGKCYIVIGDTKDRRCKYDGFRSGNIPLVTTFGTSSFGLNLQVCNEIHFSTLPFDYARVDQAKHRIKRIGQTDNIVYHEYAGSLKIDDFVKKNILKKGWLDELVKKNVKVGDVL